jgi:hypothetical protein
MMKKFASILVLCLQLACGVFSTPQPTATPQPTSTSTPAPTVTNISTSTPEIDFGDMAQLVALDGFTIEIPFFYLYEVDNGAIFVGNEEDTLSMIFFSDEYDNTTSLVTVVDNFLLNLEQNENSNLESTVSEKITIDGVEGISVDFVGQLFGFPTQGMAIVVSPFPNILVFGLANSNLESDSNLWESQHKAAFETFIDSIKFVNVTGSCIISIDNTYGYTEENPIKVGGGAFDGPSREEVYLDNLLGPNGESLSYERQGSTQTDITILDIYIVTGSGVNETLYLDEYNYSEPQAPLGFTCKGEFPLTAP